MSRTHPPHLKRLKVNKFFSLTSLNIFIITYPLPAAPLALRSALLSLTPGDKLAGSPQHPMYPIYRRTSHADLNQSVYGPHTHTHRGKHALTPRSSVIQLPSSPVSWSKVETGSARQESDRRAAAAAAEEEIQEERRGEDGADTDFQIELLFSRVYTCRGKKTADLKTDLLQFYWLRFTEKNTCPSINATSSSY